MGTRGRCGMRLRLPPTSPPSKSSASSAQPATQSSSGLRDEMRVLRDKILRVNSPVVILKSAAVFAEYRDVVRVAERVEGVVAATPFVFLQLRIASAGHASLGVAVKGIDPRPAGGMRDLGPAPQALPRAQRHATSRARRPRRGRPGPQGPLRPRARGLIPDSASRDPQERSRTRTGTFMYRARAALK